MKNYLSTLEELKKLPIEVQRDLADHLDIYSEANVTYEYGRYSVSNSSCIRSYYAPDHKCWFFDKATVQQIPELAEIIKKGEEEYEEWNRTHDVNWDALM